jgi:hypothetical protein
MTRTTPAPLYGRVSLIIAAFALVTGIITQPLWASHWPAAITVTESSQSRLR